MSDDMILVHTIVQKMHLANKVDGRQLSIKHFSQSSELNISHDDAFFREADACL